MAGSQRAAARLHWHGRRHVDDHQPGSQRHSPVAGSQCPWAPQVHGNSQRAPQRSAWHWHTPVAGSHWPCGWQGQLSRQSGPQYWPGQRELHWAPKNPGGQRHRPGFTHTSPSLQASGPSQMAEKYPTQVTTTGALTTRGSPPAPLAGSQRPVPLKSHPGGARGTRPKTDPGSRAQVWKAAPGGQEGSSLLCYSRMVHS